VGDLAVVIPHEAAYVVAGYVVTFAGLLGYAASVIARARRARRRVRAIVERRDEAR
jgi:hypothetical protein